MNTPKIAQYAHTEADLWHHVGPLLTSREVVKSLGGPVYSDERAVWWVATIRGKCVGFSLLLDTDRGYWEAGSYVLPDCRGKGIHLSLCAARTRHIATLPPKMILMCCRRPRWKHYLSRGFAVESERGEWVYGVKQPPKTEETK